MTITIDQKLVNHSLKSATLYVHPQYMAQLDSLRAFAVSAVMFFHFYQGGHAGVLPWGDWGVKLFFVLSGFLITGILLKGREQNSGFNSTTHILKQFYIRRSLRIFPLFYLVVFVTALVDIQPVRETMLWHLTYTSNFYFALTGSWKGVVSHFWTLAVEEQFYLIWPCLVLFLRSKYLLPCMVIAILLSPLYQICGFFLKLNPLAISLIMISCLEYLGMGALLAYFRHYLPNQYSALGQHPLYVWLGVVLMLTVVALTLISADNFFLGILNGFVAAIFFSWLIHKTSLGFGGMAGKLLEAKPLLFLGKISYGLYIYHNFMPLVVPSLFRRLYISWPYNLTAQFIWLVTATTVLAACSWFFFERPISNLKNRFEYSKV